MRISGVRLITQTLFLCLSLRSFNPSFYLFEVINPSIFMRIKLFQLFCVPFMYLEIRYLRITFILTKGGSERITEIVYHKKATN